VTYDHPMAWAGFIATVLGTIGTIVGTCVTIADFRRDRRKHSQHAASKAHAEQARVSRSRWVSPNILVLDVMVLAFLAAGIFLITQSRGTPGPTSGQGATQSASTKPTSPSPSAGQRGPTPSTAPPSVFYTGQRTLANGYYANLDNPSWAVSSSDTAGATFDLGAYSSGRLEGDFGDWGILNTSEASGYAACANFTAFNDSLMPVSDLPPGTQLCVRTSLGRIGLLKVLSTSDLNDDPKITFQVTVWNPS
jgi:hypothetical protein